MSRTAPEPALLTPKDVAERLGVSPKTVQRITSRGELVAIHPGRYPRYTEREVTAYVEAMESAARSRVRRSRVA